MIMSSYTVDILVGEKQAQGQRYERKYKQEACLKNSSCLI